MKKIFCFILTGVLFALASCSGQYDNIEKYGGEIVYPASYDTAFYQIGYNRVEIDLLKQGRVPSDQIKMGKASQTIVEYDGKQYPQGEVKSWVNVTGLTEAKLYRIKVYTEDEFHNYSVPQEIAIIPFTDQDKDLLGVGSPKLTITPTSMVVDWPNGISSAILDYYGLAYNYKDKNGQTATGSIANSFFVCNNLAPETEVTVNIDYRVVPILSDGTKLLDTIVVSKQFAVTTPNASTPFTPTEAQVLRINGVTTFTSAACQSITKLTYPLHMSSFADLLYFPNLTELDLTGAGLQNVLPTLVYDRNGVKTQCGGGEWQPFMARVEKPADINISGLPLLLSMMQSGQITKVRYIPNSLNFESRPEFEPFVANGVVEFVQNDDPIFPDVVFIQPQFYVKGQPVDNNWSMDCFYSGDYFPRAGLTDCLAFNSDNETVNGDPVNLQFNQLLQPDGKNIFKCVIKMRSASFAMNLPKEYRYDNQRYKKLRFKMFCGTAAADMSGYNGNFLAPWIRPMNYMWNFGNNSIYGQESWGVDCERIPTPDIRNNWKEYTIDMQANNGGPTSNRRNRCIVFNIGHEPSEAFSYNAEKEVVLYVADIRFTKD
ncbi:MAG: DUF4998 domain-containing protein [Tannerella sp.]|jgi:hypothetical protein|nr:DUF4998 domain-containing protein [Tannerella sp.]